MNLELEVLGRRDDGLHELRTRMQSIDIHDLLDAELAEETSLVVTGFEVPPTANTVLRAHAALEEATGRRLPTRFRLHKRIPPGSGLGGASSDAAAAMRALAVIHGVDIDLREVATEVGADVTFFLTGGAALVEGIGERVTPVDCVGSWFAIAWPGVELSTAAVYIAWDEAKGDGPNELRRAAGRVDGRVEDFAQKLGVRWQMTGSGSAFFRTCADRTAAIAATENLACWTATSFAVGPWA